MRAKNTIQNNFDRMTAAWAAGDAAAFASEFTDDASYVVYVGLTYVGRPAIRDAHVPVFEKWQRGTRLSMEVLDTRLIGEGDAVVTTEGGIGKGKTIRYDKVQTSVMVDTEAGWRCAGSRTPRRTASSSRPTGGLSVVSRDL